MGNEKILITNLDLKEEYEIIEPIYYHISSTSFFKNLDEMEKKSIEYKEILNKFGINSSDKDSRYDKAFYISLEEMKKKAKLIGADAIIGLRHSMIFPINRDTFDLHTYGTAVKRKYENR